MNPTVTVEIPGGSFCRHDDFKPCIFAKYSKKMCGYNCSLHHKILRGGENPRKLPACMEHCKQQQNRINSKESGAESLESVSRSLEIDLLSLE